MSQINPLVLTPRPYPGESLQGLILRTSEMNGYDSPTVMLSIAGMTNGEMRASYPPMDKLAPLYNRTPDAFAVMGYTRPWKDRWVKQAPVHHHMLPTAYLRSKRPRICPECILEQGYIEAYWDLRYSIVCPRHARISIHTCPACNKALSWQRPGLLTCKCGEDLSGLRGPSVEHEPILGLLEIIRSKVMREPLQHAAIAARLGFPVDHLDQMSLDTLLGIIGHIEGRRPSANGHTGRNATGIAGDVILQRSADALQHWPNGLFKYLISLKPAEGSKKGFGLRKQFESFFGAIFKAGYPAQEVAFIRDAFLQFGRDVWKQGFVSATLLGDASPESPLVGVERYAAAMGVMPATVRSLVKRGVIAGTPVTSRGRTRLLFDLRQPLPFLPAEGESLTLRKAAARLQLPTSVLQLLRAQGHFEINHLSKPAKAYHERDVDAFAAKLLRHCPARRVKPSKGCITLSEAMATKTGDPVIKASLVVAVLEGTLLPLGRHFEMDCMPVFEREEVESFLEIRQEQHFGTMTVVAAAKLLHCDPIVVKGMFERGVLEGERIPRGIFLDKTSVEAFADEYISCAAIASLVGMQSRAIVQQFSDTSISWHPRGETGSPQPFVTREIAALVFGKYMQSPS